MLLKKVWEPADALPTQLPKTSFLGEDLHWPKLTNKKERRNLDFNRTHSGAVR
jgi:hypothetical protein